MWTPTPVFLSLLVSSGVQQREPNAAEFLLTKQENQQQISLLSFANAKCEVDNNGLRGLKWTDAFNDMACSVPLNRAIVISNDDEEELMRKFLAEIYSDNDDHAPYLDTLPRPGDLSLNTIGAKWDPQQMERLVHPPSIAKLTSLREMRTATVDNLVKTVSGVYGDNSENSKLMANWAHDIVASRCLKGNFGHQGKLRIAVACYLASVVAAVLPLAVSTGDPSIESMLPLLVSTAVLLFLHVKKKSEIALLPWIDLANHKSGTKMVFEYDILNDSINWKRTGGDPDKYDWVTFDYGGELGATNDRLLGVFGFVEIDNPNDTFEVELKNGSFATIGRFGQVQGGNDVKMDDAVLAASNARERLLSFTAENPSDSTDFTRAQVAESWRSEKIRLLDELLDLTS